MAWQAQVAASGVDALRSYLLEHALTAQQKEEVAKMLTDAESLTPSQLRSCSQWLKEIRATRDANAPTLRALLSSCGGARVVAHATTPEEEPSQARKKYLAKRREKLLRLDEEMRYGHLVKNVQTTRASQELQRNLKSTKQHLSIGANMVVSRIVAFIVAYVASRPLTDNETTVRRMQHAWDHSDVACLG
jgi:hypothetical protein